MLHHVVHTRRRLLLFQTWEEGTHLWHTLVGALPGLQALCLMPDHVHLLHPQDVRRALGHAMSGYTRWRNARRGRQGPLLRASPTVEEVAGASKRRRSLRYVHLNPCRAGMVDDPVAWPLSTHLDALGLTLPAARPAVPDRHRFHGYVSGDPHVNVGGTAVPAPGLAPYPVERVLDAVSVATRTPIPAVLHRRGPARALFLHAARTLTRPVG